MMIELLVLLLLGAPEEDSVAERLAGVEEQYRDSLVRVRYRQQVRSSTAEPPEEEELATTGVIVSPRGVVLTSAIVYEPFNQVPHGVGIRFPASVGRAEPQIANARVRLVDGSEYDATLLGRDQEADVAFFQIQSEDREFEPVSFSSVPDAVQVGEQLVVVSLLPEPLAAVSVELSRVQAVTSRPRSGFVLATGAADPVGSLAVRLSGEIVGYLDALTVPVPDARSRNPLAFLTVMRDLPKGVGRGFARPASELVDANVSLTQTSPTRRGWLGVEMQAVSPELAAHMGLPVASGVLLGYVYQGSPAESAGLRVGDVLVELGASPIDVQRDEDIGTLAEKILRAGPDASLPISYIRHGQRMEAVAQLAPAPRSSREAETLEVEELDLLVREVTYDYLATRFLQPDQRGVVIVEPPVSVSGNTNRVAPGDLVVRLGEHEVSDLRRFREVLDTMRNEKPDEVVLFVERGRESFFFAVKPDWK
ncbi:MAG TPA: trypsin-like peptidase domain-containing protein [Vicinamibacteria bacterium]|nr:trypsin-like peptidase domain-containing protein [Vicinamibacteria bacterium]